jgi:hypothetical protein
LVFEDKRLPIWVLEDLSRQVRRELSDGI